MISLLTLNGNVLDIGPFEIGETAILSNIAEYPLAHIEGFSILEVESLPTGFSANAYKVVDDALVPIEADATKLAEEAAARLKERQLLILNGMTELFDATARQKNYDNRITCALRAGYPGPFHDEGVAFATWMDTCNALAYTMLAEVQSGVREMPTTVEAALSLLPAFEW